MSNPKQLKREPAERAGGSHSHAPSHPNMTGSDYVARLHSLDLSGNCRSSSASWPPPISGHDLMAMFPTVPPTTDVCCNDIFSKQARAYLSGSREGTATPEGDAARRRVDAHGPPAPTVARRDHAQPRRGGLDALAEQACLESPSSSSSRSPPLSRGGSRGSDRPEQDAEGAINRQTRSRQSKAHRDVALLRASPPDKRTITPRPSSSQVDPSTPLFTRRPLERTTYPRFVSSQS